MLLTQQEVLLAFTVEARDDYIRVRKHTLDGALGNVPLLPPAISVGAVFQSEVHPGVA